MPDTIPCPHCGALARITERFWLHSPDGPIEHLKTGCLSKHWRTPRAETAQPEQEVTPRSRPGGGDELTGPAAAGVGGHPRAAPEFGT
jgi:hypothetical protein